MVLRNFFIIYYLKLFVIVASDKTSNKYCELPCDWVVKTVPHTVCNREEHKCGPAAECGSDFQIIHMSDEDRQYILDIHNYLRNRVALGNEKRGKQPTAANMNAMSYNRELEFIAQCWANTCKGSPLAHDICRRTSEFRHAGQNLGFVNSSTIDIDIVGSIKILIMAWYDEVKIFNSSWIKDTKEREQQVGHYTQLVWADSSEIGCAVSYYTTKLDGKKWHHIIFACNYGPGGNYIGQPLYIIGKPKSKCSRRKPSKRYKGLCGEAKKLNETENFTDIFTKIPQ